MKHLLPIAVSIILLASCNDHKPDKTIAADSVHVYPAVSYLDIKLDSHRRLPSNPYILTFEKGKKKIVFCGVTHLASNDDTDNPMFKAIEEKFYSFRPDVAVNEGGDISKKQYASRKDALSKDGEIGLTKILCDSLKIGTVDGDPADDLEFNELLKRFTKGQMLAYIATERLMWSLKGQQIKDTAEIEKMYNEFIQNYIIKKGKVDLSTTEQTFAFYRSNYEQLLQRPFKLADLEPANPFEPNGTFQKIGRTSKEIRDQYLMKTIDSLLTTHDKVFVVFGGWHLLTCKPGLEQIINASASR